MKKVFIIFLTIFFNVFLISEVNSVRINYPSECFIDSENCKPTNDKNIGFCKQGNYTTNNKKINISLKFHKNDISPNDKFSIYYNDGSSDKLYKTFYANFTTKPNSTNEDIFLYNDENLTSQIICNWAYPDYCEKIYDPYNYSQVYVVFKNFDISDWKKYRFKFMEWNTFTDHYYYVNDMTNKPDTDCWDENDLPTIQYTTNWVCWTSNNSCNSWNLVDIDDTNTEYKWYCNWSGWGSDVSCSENKPIDWACWTSKNSCSSWNLVDINDTNTEYKWNCNWEYWGSDVSCSENKPIDWGCWISINSCSSWNLVDIDDTNTEYKWNCNWEYQGSDVSCSENKPIDWVCWTSINSCSSWNLVDIDDTTTGYRWNCNWEYWGSDVSCSENKPIDWVCWTSNNSCTYWTLVDINDTTTEYKWNCNWEYWGSDVSCSENKPIDWVCWTSINSCSSWDLVDIDDTNTEYKWQCKWIGWGSDVSCSKTKDTTPPTGSISYQDWWVNSNKDITITASDDTWIYNIKLYKITDNWNSWDFLRFWNIWNSWNTAFELNDYAKNIKYKVIIEDLVLNRSEYIWETIKYDWIIPKWNISYTWDHYDWIKYWIKDSVSVNVSLLSDYSTLFNADWSWVEKSNFYIYKNWFNTSVFERNWNSDYSHNFNSFNHWDVIQYGLQVVDNVWNFNFSPNKGVELYVDKQKPTWTISYSTGWINADSININFNIIDNDSWIKNFKLIEIVDWIETEINSWIIDNWNGNYTYKKNFGNSDNGKTFSYKIKDLEDNVWNIWDEKIWWEIKFDNIKPQASDCTDINEYKFLYANTNQEIQVTCNNAWGSPIIFIKADFENLDNENIQNPEKSSNSNVLTTYENISKIDNFKEVWNYRKYTYNLKEVCDEAQNCNSNFKTFEYYVFADKIDTNKSEIISSNLDTLTNWTAIADGTEYPLKIVLKDQFGNKIAPVKYNNINRKVKINLEYDNNLYLNQFNDSWKALYVNSVELENWSNKNTDIYWTFWDSSNDNWEYILNFKSYSPTFLSWATDWRQFVKWWLTLKNINWVLEDFVNFDWTSPIVQNSELLSSTNFITQFKPVYNTTFSGSVKQYWLIEWKIQTSEIDVIKNSTKSIVNPEIYLFFDWLTENEKIDLYFDANNDTEYNNEIKIEKDTFTNPININSNKINFFTLLKQKAWTVLKTEFDTNFFSYIKYSLDWKEIIYASDYIWNGSFTQKTKQTWLSVEWNISNSVFQFTEWKNLNNIWNLTKLDFKKDIEKNIFKFLKNKNIENWNYQIKDLKDFTNNSDWAKLKNNSVLYFKWWDSNWLVTIDSELADNSIEIEWKKTIAIIWADLYIKNNMYYSDINKDILWIIVVKDENWKGWNIYIDPKVTNLIWTFYLSKTLVSWEVISWTLENDYSIYTTEKFGNQLHIFWNIFSENTIGWARSDPYKCPYYVSNCDLKNAQKYDLNYLRRFVLVHKTGSSGKNLYLPIDNWKVIWNWDCKIENISWIDKVTCDSETKYVKAVKEIKDNSMNQSVIIEYNSNLLNNIPPLFNK